MRRISDHRGHCRARCGTPGASSLTLQSYSTNATIAVKFAPNAAVGMWVPLSTEEQYRGNFNGVGHSLAKYSHYRQFKVETSTEIR